MTIPNSSKGWFMLTSSPTPIVPSAVISVFRAASNHTEELNVPIEQLDADGFPIGDGLRSRVLGRSGSSRSADRSRQTLGPGRLRRRARARGARVLRAAQSPPGSLDAAEPFTYSIGLLLDDEAQEFRSSVGELPERLART